MATDVILAIDQGTTNSKAILIDRDGQIVAHGSAALDIAYPKPGWVEQSADHIWQSVVDAIGQCLARAPDARPIAIGISNQRESVVAWDAGSGRPLGPAITWQCRRTSAETGRLKAEGHEPLVLEKTGLPLDPLFPASKIRYLLDMPGPTDRRVGTVDSWLIHNLSGGECFATERANASRTQLLNVQTGNWDADLCALFGVDASRLPTVHDSSHQFGVTRGVPGLPDGVPITSAIGDSHAALFGHAAFHPGEAKVTFGTGSSVMMVVPGFRVPRDGMTTTIAWSIGNTITHALEGNILVSASLFPWTATLLGLGGDVDRLMALAESVDGTEGVNLVPALAGLGAPHWQPDARGIVSGLSFSSTPAHVARAAALSMPLQVLDVFQAMQSQSSTAPARLYVDGGPTRNGFLMQCVADLLDTPVSISRDPELSALGAGMLAGLQIGFWSGLEAIAALPRQRTDVAPSMPADVRDRILSDWHDAVDACIRYPASAGAASGN